MCSNFDAVYWKGMVRVMKADQKTSTEMSNFKYCLFALGLLTAFGCAADSSTPTISLRKLPENLQKQYEKVQHDQAARAADFFCLAFFIAIFKCSAFTFSGNSRVK